MGGNILYIARQPIFDKQKKLYGYELLFRNKQESKLFSKEVSSTVATATVIDGLFEAGIDNIVDGKRAFVNFDYEFLMSEAIELINPDTLIVEVLEDVVVDEPLLERIRYLKSKGYKIALDDFVEDYKDYLLTPVADIIKYDLMETPLEEIKNDVELALRDKKTLLAEKIETNEEFLLAQKMGFHLFQGYFFFKPSIITRANDKKSLKGQYCRILQELHKEEPSYQNLAEIIETDINLAYRFMRVVSHKQTEEPIYSIKSSLVYMGLKELERWINVLMLRELSSDKPMAIMSLSLVRAKFSEYISDNSIYRKRKLEISIMCLLSVLDAILDMPMNEALEDLSLSEDVKEALVNRTGNLSPIFELVCAYEGADWEKVNELSSEIGLNKDVIMNGYFEALKWASEIMDIS